MRSLVGLMISLAVFARAVGQLSAEPVIAGYIEKVRLHPGDFEIHAKLDTGAKTSSINARPTVFKRDGKNWVRFDVTNRMGVTKRFEHAVVRISKIRRSGAKTEERPVIQLGICLGGVYKVAEVNLKNRTGMNYQMLIGRTFMASDVLVNSQEQYLTEPKCDLRRGPK